MSMDVWIGGLAVDERSPAEVHEALCAFFTDNEYERCEGDDIHVVGDERALIIGGTKGWTSVYLEEFDHDEAVALAISKTLETTVVCHRSVLYDAFAIFVYYGGELIDEFQSCPDYFKAYDEPDSTESELARTAGQADALQSLVSRVDGALLAEIYQQSRLESLTEDINPEMSVGEALKQLRKALKIGTFEHSFDDLWYSADDMNLKVNYLGFLSPHAEPKTRWGILKKHAAESRGRWRQKKERFKDKVNFIKSKWPLSRKKSDPEESSEEEGQTPADNPDSATVEKPKADDDAQ
ncbi:MAG: hypothetical protein P1V97_15175 [Planctomycetota bacterium]|nr:hypothetical protein [Planctomycetota bacterium]